jgi:hypothetical protein
MSRVSDEMACVRSILRHLPGRSDAAFDRFRSDQLLETGGAVFVPPGKPAAGNPAQCGDRAGAKALAAR